MTPEYLSLTREECASRLLRLKHPVILIHEHPDGDCVGSMCALARVLHQLGKRVSYLSSDKIPERLEFLLDAEEELWADEIERSLDTRDFISVDVASPNRLGKYAYLADRVCLMIDHHAVGTPFADGYVVPDASSTGEVLLDVIDALVAQSALTLTKEIATPLYAAVSSDTGRFAYSSATAETYRCAARLIELGIDHAGINHALFFSKSESELRCDGLVTNAIRSAADGKIAYAVITKQDKDSLGLVDSDLECAVDIVRTLRHSRVAFIVKDTDDGRVRASLRSCGPDVAKIAAVFGGGGHILAAGCSFTDMSASEAAERLIELISDALLQEGKNDTAPFNS